MARRITRAAMHLPQDVVRERMQAEQRLWRRRCCEITYEALIAP